MVEVSTLQIKRLLLNNQFLENDMNDLLLHAGDPACVPCLKIIQALNDTGEELDKGKFPLADKLYAIRTQMDSFRGKIPPGLSDINETFFTTNEAEIDKLKRSHSELMEDYNKFLGSKLETLRKIIELPETQKEAQEWFKRFEKLDSNIKKSGQRQENLAENLDKVQRRTLSSSQAGPTMAPVPKLGE